MTGCDVCRFHVMTGCDVGRFDFLSLVMMLCRFDFL